MSAHRSGVRTYTVRGPVLNNFAQMFRKQPLPEQMFVALRRGRLFNFSTTARNKNHLEWPSQRKIGLPKGRQPQWALNFILQTLSKLKGQCPVTVGPPHVRTGSIQACIASAIPRPPRTEPNAATPWRIILVDPSGASF